MSPEANLEQKYEEFESRSTKLMPLFKLTSFIHKYKIFRPFLYIPSPFLNQWAHLLAPLILKKDRLKVQIFRGLEALYSTINLSQHQKERLYNANAIYMGTLYLDAMFHSSNIYANTLSHFVSFKNMEYIYAALKAGKGAIIPSVHVGMFFQVLASLVYIRPRLEITTVIQPRNRVMYENILNRPELTNFHVVPSTNFAELKEILADRLEKNHLVVVYYDYSKAHQLRVPFDMDTYPYLITTPQSIFKLHKIHQSPIIPAILTPHGEFGRSIITFQNPELLDDISSRYSSSASKEYLGEMSTTLNRIFGNHLRKYNHLWEEFRKFSTRCSDLFEVKQNWTTSQLILHIQEKIQKILDQSYEPGRADSVILENVAILFQEITDLLVMPQKQVIQSTAEISLSFKSAVQEIFTLLEFLIKILEESGEVSAKTRLMEFLQKEGLIRQK